MSTGKSPALLSSQLWYEAAELKADAISKLNKRKFVLDTVNYETLQHSLQEIQQRHSARRSSVWFSRLKPVIAHLQAFNNAVSLIAQGGSSIACLLWGSTIILLECASGVSDTLEKVINMFESISRAMPRFEEYMQLYPQREGLQVAMLKIYCTYLDFCIQMARIFKHGALLQILKNFWKMGSIMATFKAVLSAVREATSDFEAEASLAQSATSAAHMKHMEQVFSHVEISPQQQRSVFSVPWSRNHRFFGREVELESLQQKFSLGDSEQVSCVLHGMAGVGKTQTALEYAYRSRGLFQYVFWIPAHDEPSILETISKIPLLLGLLPTGNFVDFQRGFENARTWLHMNQQWLIIFDNADASELLDRYWPACNHGSILVTSQDRKLVYRARFEVQLKSFTEKEGSDLLLKHISSKEAPRNTCSADLAKSLSSEVGGLPLLLVGLAGHIVDSQSSISQTLEDMQQPCNQDAHLYHTISEDSATFQYGRPIKMAFDLSMSRLPATAMATLRIMSVLSPDSIIEDLVAIDLDDESLSFLGYQDKSRYCREVRKHLITRNLVDFDETLGEGVYSLHRLLQWKIMCDLNANSIARQRTFNQAIALIRRSFPKLSDFMVPMYEEWNSYEKLIAHVLRLVEVHRIFSKSSPPIECGFEFAELLASAGNYLYERTFAKSGLDILNTAARICEASSPIYSPSGNARDDTYEINATECTHQQGSFSVSDWIKLESTILTISWGILSASQGLNGRKDAHACITRVLQLRERHFEMQNPPKERFWSQVLLSNAYNDMACELIDMEDYCEAETYLAKSLKMKDELSSQQIIPSFEYAESKKNLAYVRMAQGRKEEGVSLSQEAAKLVEEEQGLGSASTQLFRFIHGTFLVGVGQLTDALEILLDVHSFRQEKFGREGLHTLHSSFAVAFTQYHLHHFHEAKIMISNCFSHKEETQWPHECVLRANYLQSLILQSLEEIDQAIDMRTTSMHDLQGLFCKHSKNLWTNLQNSGHDDLDPLVLFDHAVPFEAGRFTIGTIERLIRNKL